MFSRARNAKFFPVVGGLVAIESLVRYVLSCAGHLGIFSGFGILPTFPHFPSDSFTLLF